jgi:hypothetical protein
MFIWRGAGILVPMIAFVCSLLAEAKDHRVPLAARRRDRRPRIAPLRLAPLSGRV